ncbi:outer membrane lipoprotein-sorting protein [candidate division KSB1 bacterium]|nr:outer membrane lipoprotein-sorting protein [candidate division KSB1 bacterium]
MKYAIYIFVLITQISSASIVNGEEPDLAASEIIHKLRENFSKIRDYTVDLHAIIEMEDVHIPPMDVKVFFKQPDKIFIKSDGFAMLPREGIIQNPAKFNEDNFYMDVLAVEMIDSAMTYKLELIPRTDESMARKIIIWVEPEKWVMKRLESISWQGQKTVMKFDYQKVQNEFWLPSKTIANLTLSGFTGLGGMMQMQQRNEIDSKKERKGTLIITFSDYDINSGLQDSLFEKREITY